MREKPATEGFVLETERLILREMVQDDLPALCAMLQDPEVMYAYEGPFSDAEAQAWLDGQRTRYREDGMGLWAAVLKETGRMVGQCGLTWQDFDGDRVLEVGYLFQRAFWHRGLATEAARACRDHAFNRLGAQEVFSIIRDANEASRRVALRNGMVPRGTLVKRYRGVDMPHVAFSVRRDALGEDSEDGAPSLT